MTTDDRFYWSVHRDLRLDEHGQACDLLNIFKEEITNMLYVSLRRLGSITIVPRGAACTCPDPWEILKTEYGYALGFGNGRVCFLERDDAEPRPCGPLVVVEF